jgi:hypothetical protein
MRQCTYCHIAAEGAAGGVRNTFEAKDGTPILHDNR